MIYSGSEIQPIAEILQNILTITKELDLLWLVEGYIGIQNKATLKQYFEAT